MFGDPRSDAVMRLMDVSLTSARVHAANLANQNTPGYKAKAVAFLDQFHQAMARGDDGDAMAIEPKLVEPRDTPVGVDGNDVDPDREVLASAEDSMRYNAMIAIMRGKAHLLSTAISQVP